MLRNLKEEKSKLESESEVAQSCPTLCDPVVCSLPGSSVHGILQARILEWVAISFSRGSSRPRDRTRVSHIAGRHFNLWATREEGLGKYKYTKTKTIKTPHVVASPFVSIHLPLPVVFLIFFAIIKIDCIDHVVNLAPAFTYHTQRTNYISRMIFLRNHPFCHFYIPS